MELWRRCFEDTDEFIRFYFERKYSNANSLIYEENGKALSALLRKQDRLQPVLVW